MSLGAAVDVQKHGGEDVWKQDGEASVGAEERVDVAGGGQVVGDI